MRLRTGAHIGVRARGYRTGVFVGDRIAFQVLESERTLPLSVIDIGTGETVEITESAIASFFWSPDGERLLYLDPGSPDGEQLWFRWGVWYGTSSFLTPRFIPSELIAIGYLQFFEQYAQSMSLWSPDSSSFAYPGMSEDGERGDLDPVGTARPRAGPRRRGRLRGLVTRLIGTESPRAPPISLFGIEAVGKIRSTRRPGRVVRIGRES
ncbi:MAG TPA: hypothetical protein VKB32_01705 [Actinomycetota bacterium]|nr:hypothetical protein [Actinomycetota bacterium]